jgi:hypothetical protein
VFDAFAGNVTVRVAIPLLFVFGQAGPVPPQTAAPPTLNVMVLFLTPALVMLVNVAVSVTGPPAVLSCAGDTVKLESFPPLATTLMGAVPLLATKLPAASV